MWEVVQINLAEVAQVRPGKVVDFGTEQVNVVRILGQPLEDA